MWVVLVSNDHDTDKRSLLDVAYEAAGGVHTFENLNIHKDLTTKTQVHKEIKRDLQTATSTRVSSLLTGSPFTKKSRGPYIVHKFLEYELCNLWDGYEFAGVDKRRPMKISTRSTLVVAWEVSDLEWSSGFRGLDTPAYSRLLPFRVGAGYQNKMVDAVRNDTQHKDIEAAYKWATRERRILQLTRAGAIKWYSIRQSERVLLECLTGTTKDHFVRLGEHTLRIAAALAASERTTAIGGALVEAAWSLVRRSIVDAFHLAHSIGGQIDTILTDIDNKVSTIGDADPKRPISAAYVPPGPHDKDAFDQNAGHIKLIIKKATRDSLLASRIKSWYRDRCQICGTTLSIPAPPFTYSEAAHIQAFGGVHDGPDCVENLLCLCPNCHVLFDKGARYLTDDFRIMDAVTGQELGELTVHPQHHIDLSYVRQHRQRWNFGRQT
ncbi:HNH endonuclease [Microbispora sp. CA-135349]|uniref:HNH endonuclease n=1 Tax=Microbispora sp. CA-135349 TaxID=3239953 RepID=UPI003D8F6FC5